MKDFCSRTKQLAIYIIQNQTTIRKTAKAFGLSKSTVHYDLSKRLPKINKSLYLQLQELLDKNFAEKNIRGGAATKQKYMKLHCKK